MTEASLISVAQLFHNRWLWLSSDKAPLISSPVLVLTVCALSVTVAAISHILFILGASLHTFVLISKCRVICSQPGGCLSVCLLVCGLGYKRKRREQEVTKEKPHPEAQAGRKLILGKQVISCC